MTAPNHCDFSAADFRATAIESSAGRLIRVTGSGLCPTSGWELRLVAANPGVVDFRHEAFNQRDELVATCTRQAFMLKRPEAS